jgi:hypothetical protein
VAVWKREGEEKAILRREFWKRIRKKDRKEAGEQLVCLV